VIVRFTRLSPTHHRFEAIRDDGTRDVREFETRSLLLHDFVHLALEGEGTLTAGFYGTLARGAAYDAPRPGSEAMAIEAVVGPLQGALKGEVDAHAFVTRLRAMQASVGDDSPAWLTPELIARTLERLRQLQGQWRATPFGETMEVRFDL
jgi:hypothetical protein